MHVASLPRFRLGRLAGVHLVLLYALIIGLALLAFAVALMAGATQNQPDPELLAPFRWLGTEPLA